MDVIGWLARVWNGVFVTAPMGAFWSISPDHKKNLPQKWNLNFQIRYKDD